MEEVRVRVRVRVTDIRVTDVRVRVTVQASGLLSPSVFRFPLRIR